MLISLDVKSFDRHGFPWLQSTKHIYNIDNIYKKSTFPPPGFFFFSFYKTAFVNQPPPAPLPYEHLFHFSPLCTPSPTVQSQPNCSSYVLRLGGQQELNKGSPSGFQLRLCAMGCFPALALTLNQKFSDHERILILQFFKFFDLLSQE